VILPFFSLSGRILAKSDDGGFVFLESPGARRRQESHPGAKNTT